MHIIEPKPGAVYGYFSKDTPPTLTIDSGETIRYKKLLDASWRYYDDEAGQLVAAQGYDDVKRGHALHGPVYINGAQPGMTLAVKIGEITVAGAGWNHGGGGVDWDLWKRLDVHDENLTREQTQALWILDRETNTGTHPTGKTVTLSPFLGVLGMPPPENGEHATAPPYWCGGNMDCKALTAGSTVYLPIPVEGGLFFAGDGHALQGDGEVSGTAIEVGIEQVDLTLTLLPEMSINTPHAKTSDGYITLGFHENLDEAKYIALNAMLDYMQATYDLTRRDALSIASTVVDLRVTQIVNGVQGIHAVLPDGAIR